MFHELIRALVYGDGRVRATGEHGMTALHYAVLVSLFIKTPMMLVNMVWISLCWILYIVYRRLSSYGCSCMFTFCFWEHDEILWLPSNIEVRSHCLLWGIILFPISTSQLMNDHMFSMHITCSCHKQWVCVLHIHSPDSKTDPLFYLLCALTHSYSKCVCVCYLVSLSPQWDNVYVS